MMTWRRIGICAVVLSICPLATARSAEAPSSDRPAFTTVVLGAAGGLTEDNLSSYLLAPAGETGFVAIDAGTLRAGVRRAQTVLRGLGVPTGPRDGWESTVLREHVKAYLITHAHLDHVAGLVLNSPADTRKSILALRSTIHDLTRHVFNWRTWPNFGDAGQHPLGLYDYVVLREGAEQPVPGTDMTVEAFALSHGGVVSTAFLLQSGGAYALFVGDTGADAVENSDKLRKLWTRTAPLVRAHKLRGVFLEASYPNERPDDRLFGHLTPAWLFRELHRLADRAGADSAAGEGLRGLTVIITHVKPSSEPGEEPRERIREQLDALNDLGLRIVIPEQGDRVDF
jgi:3',5'-cyclic-nucleotide phosphodiesterase